MFKIPNFLSKHLSKFRDDDKNKEIAAYKTWHGHRFTELWIEGLNSRINQLVIEDEKLSGSTEFEFCKKSLANKVERKLLRDIIDKLNYKVN